MEAFAANTIAVVLIWDRPSVQVFLVQGQLIPGSGPSLVGLGAQACLLTQRRWEDILPQLQTRNSQ